MISNVLLLTGRFAHSGATEITNGGFQEYQNGPSTVSRGPVPYFHQHAMHGMQAHNLLDPTQMQVPYQQCHNNGVLHGGVNYPGNRLHLGPRIPVVFSSPERTFGPPQHTFLANPVNHRNIRILPPEVTLHFNMFCQLAFWLPAFVVGNKNILPPEVTLHPKGNAGISLLLQLLLQFLNCQPLLQQQQLLLQVEANTAFKVLSCCIVTAHIL